MISGIFKKMNGVLFHPTETFAKTIPKDTLKDTLIYLLILAGIFTILEALLLLMGEYAYVSILSGVAVGSFPEMALILILFFAGLVVSAVIFAAYMHIWAYLAGGREGITETGKAVIYALTPFLIFGWIPLLGFVMGLWSFILIVMAIRELQNLTLVKAFFAVAIGYLILVYVGMAVIGSLLATTLAIF